jgi:hypothetical protein
MLPVGIEPTISAGERPQNYAFDRAAIGTGVTTIYCTEFSPLNVSAITVHTVSLRLRLNIIKQILFSCFEVLAAL